MPIPVQPAACLRAREAVSARLDGELSELEAARLEQHLRGCGPCAEFAAGAEEVARRLRVAALEPAPDELFLPRRRRIAAPYAAAAATFLIAAATGSSFLVGHLLGARSGRTPAPATTAAAATGVDPSIVAMLRNHPGGRAQTGRVIAL